MFLISFLRSGRDRPLRWQYEIMVSKPRKNVLRWQYEIMVSKPMGEGELLDLHTTTGTVNVP